MQKVKLAVLTLVAAALSVRCGGEVVGVREITELPRDLTAAEEELIQSDNAFGLKLFREIYAQEEEGANLFVSPLSVAMALGMTYNGAVGATQQAMQETLELQGLTIDEVNQSYRSLIDLLRNLDPNVEFLLANSIWYREGFAVEQDFLDVNREYFDAEVAALDFASPTAAPTINNWVSDKTMGRIEDIVDDPIPWDVVMYLIDAIYFKGDWAIQFDPELTATRPFYLADGGQVQAPMMTFGAEAEVRAYADADVQVLDLYYGGKAYSMTILVPAAGSDLDALDALVGSLDPARWQEIVSGLTAISTDVVMPKFTLEYELEMKDVLTALGMGIAFGGAADFSKIRASGGLYISKVKHKTFVDVNEEGTEAAAATSVEIREFAMPPLVIDRPFLFAIREGYSGTILFMGRVVNPVGGSQ